MGSVARFGDYSEIWGFFFAFGMNYFALGKFPKCQYLGMFGLFVNFLQKFGIFIVVLALAIF